MPKPDEQRKRLILDALRRGEGTPAIVRAVGCSRGLVAHYRRKAVVQSPIDVDGMDLLRQRAREGSVQACVALVRLEQAKADSCHDHIPRDAYERAMLEVFGTVRDCVLRVKDDLLFDGMRVDLETAIRNKLDETRLALNAKYGPEPTAIVEDKAAA